MKINPQIIFLLYHIIFVMIGPAGYAAPLTLYKTNDIENARSNIAKHAWAKEILRQWRNQCAYIMSKDGKYIESMIAKLTPWPLYGQNCPVCVGTKSSMGETGIYEWSVLTPDQLKCKYCGTVYPNTNYTETGRLQAARMGQTFSYYLTDDERANPQDKTGQYAFKWAKNNPVHTSWTGLIRYKKGIWCISQVLKLAKLYAVTGEIKYAEQTAIILNRVAVCFPTWLYHSYDGTYADCPPGKAADEMGRNPPGGRFPKEVIVSAFTGRHVTTNGYATLFNGFFGAGRFVCSGTDANLVLSLTIAYDLIKDAQHEDGSPVLSKDARKRIVSDLILAGCKDVENWNEYNNKIAGPRALSAAVGVLFDYPDKVRRAIDGMNYLLDNFFYIDGHCKESLSYAQMHLNYMQNIPDILSCYIGKHVAADVTAHQYFDKYRLAMEALYRVADSNGKYPVLRATHYGSSAPVVYAEILTDRYGDQYAPLLQRTYGTNINNMGDEYALWHRNANTIFDVNKADKFSDNSEWYPGWHVAVLRGSEAGKKTTLYFDGASYGYAHHRDILGIIYSAFGQELAFDQGYMWDDPREEWTGSTLAHNVVVVDGRNQIDREYINGPIRQSSLEYFFSTPSIKIIQASANAYNQCDTYRRTVALVNIDDNLSYAIDIFRIQGGQRHQYSFRCQGGIVDILGAGMSNSTRQIKWLSDIQEGQPHNQVKIKWKHNDVYTDLILLNNVDRLFSAQSPGWRDSTGGERAARPIPQIIAERYAPHGLTSQYVSIVSPYLTNMAAPIQSAGLINCDLNGKAVGIFIKLKDRTDYFISSMDNEFRQYGDIKMSGRIGFMSIGSKSNITQALLVDGTCLEYNNTALKMKVPRLTCKIDKTDKNVFHVHDQINTNLLGNILGVLASNTGYQVDSVNGKKISVKDYDAIKCDQLDIINAYYLSTSNYFKKDLNP